MHTGKLDRFHLTSSSYHTSSRNEGGDRDATHTYIYRFPLRLRLFVGCDCGPGVAGQTPFHVCPPETSALITLVQRTLVKTCSWASPGPRYLLPSSLLISSNIPRHVPGARACDPLTGLACTARASSLTDGCSLSSAWRGLSWHLLLNSTP